MAHRSPQTAFPQMPSELKEGGFRVLLLILSFFCRLVLDEVTRLLNMEKHLPSYKYMVSVSCLKVIRKLQKFGHLPSLPHIYHSYAEYGIFLDLRIAAMECLVDFVKVDGRSEDLDHLITLLETDPDPAARHALAQLLIDNPPFTRESRSRLDKPNLVERLWLSINTLAYDTKLRCDIVDLYYALYGSTRPKCLQATESQSFYKDFIKEGSTAPISFKKASSESKAPAELTEVSETPERHKPAMVTIKRTATEAFEVGDEIIKLERSEEIQVMDEPIDVQAYDSETKINVMPVEDAAASGESQPQVTKRMKTEVYTEDDNSTMVLDVGESQTTRYESSYDESKLKADGSVKKKKKKDKKKHKHKHKHKHNKEKDKDKERGDRERKDKDRRDPQISRLQAREAATPETLSSADSSNSNSNTPLGMN